MISETMLSLSLLGPSLLICIYTCFPKTPKKKKKLKGKDFFRFPVNVFYVLPYASALTSPKINPTHVISFWSLVAKKYVMALLYLEWITHAIGMHLVYRCIMFICLVYRCSNQMHNTPVIIICIGCSQCWVKCSGKMVQLLIHLTCNPAWCEHVTCGNLK